MRYGSAFAGIGGFDLGFKRAGMVCAWQVEINPACRSVLTRHLPGAKRYEDIRGVGDGREELEPVDLVCGGFPCQDISVAGKRAGLAGERSGLWFELHRIIGELKPRWVVVENVPGLLSSNGGRDFSIVLRGLVECGYGVAWRILDAQYFAVAQRRRRVFIVGSLGSGRCAEVLFESEGGAWDSPPSREAGARVAAPLTRGPATGRGVNEPGRRIEDDVNLVAYTLPASARGTGDGHGNALNSNYISAPLKAESPSRRNGGSAPIADEFVVANTLGSHHGRNDQDGMGTYVAYNWQSGGDVILSFGKPQIQASQVPAVGVRRLTPTECERLQGFPDGWTEYFLSGVQCVIMGTWLEHFALLPDVVARLWTGKPASVSCTTSGSRNTEVSIYQSGTIPHLPDAQSVIGWLEGAALADFVPDTTSLGNGTAILCDQSGTPLSAPPMLNGDGDITVLLLRLWLDGPCDAEKLSTISTWTQRITPLLTYTFAETRLSMVAYTLRWSAQLPSLSRADTWCLRTANIARASDSVRYRQLGNAVCVPVAEWLGRRIMQADDDGKSEAD